MIDKLITSQHFIDANIVAQKITAGDFEVQVSPEFEIGGETFRVILDGHHSLAAAIEAGIAPTIIEQDAASNDRVALLATGDIETFLEACWMDGEYQYAVSGKSVW